MPSATSRSSSSSRERYTAALTSRLSGPRALRARPSRGGSKTASATAIRKITIPQNAMTETPLISRSHTQARTYSRVAPRSQPPMCSAIHCSDWREEFVNPSSL